LLRHARAAEVSVALPVLRRLLAAKLSGGLSLSALHRQRGELQLKTLLRLLAVELGYADWAACKAVIDSREAACLDRYRLDAGAFGDFEKTWFTNAAMARDWQREHGGYVVPYGEQAVAILRPA
jgi:hypothetical protein